MLKGAFFTEDERIYVNAPYMEGYIPKRLFKDNDGESTIACYYGEGIKTIGIFAVRVFTSEDMPRDKVELRTFAYPNPIETYPSEITEEKLQLFPSDKGEVYVVLKYHKGDLMMDELTKKDTLNCEKFINMVTKGKLSQSIPYDVAEQLWMSNMSINGFDPGVPGIVPQLILSEMYRNPSNPIEQFRKIASNKGVTMRDGIWYNMNEVSAFTNVLSALSFERISDKITTSINMTKSGVKQNRSPVEKVLTM